VLRRGAERMREPDVRGQPLPKKVLMRPFVRSMN
jgi:hypothetical protein